MFLFVTCAQMLYDGLPVQGFLGKPEKSVPTNYFLYAHVLFDVSYNRQNLTWINVSMDRDQKVDISGDVHSQFEFAFSAKWEQLDSALDQHTNDCTQHSITKHHSEVRILARLVGSA